MKLERKNIEQIFSGSIKTVLACLTVDVQNLKSVDKDEFIHRWLISLMCHTRQSKFLQKLYVTTFSVN